MKTDTDPNTGRMRITAEDGMALHRIGTSDRTSVVRVVLRDGDSPDNWEDCELGEPETPDEPNMADKDEALRRFGVEV